MAGEFNSDLVDHVLQQLRLLDEPGGCPVELRQQELATQRVEPPQSLVRSLHLRTGCSIAQQGPQLDLGPRLQILQILFDRHRFSPDPGGDRIKSRGALESRGPGP